MNVKPNFLDKAVAYFAPSRGLQRVQARAAWNMLPSIRSTAGSNRGPVSNWVPQFLSRREEGEHRGRSSARAQDLVANDAHAASVINSMATNIVGTGIEPQSRPKQEVLGWTDEEVKRFQQQAEWVYRRWCKFADAREHMTFAQIQDLTVRSLLTNGEYFRIPIMLQGTRRPLGLALQSISPMRVTSPLDFSVQDNIRDGIQLDSLGRPRRYFVYDPPRGTDMPSGPTGTEMLGPGYFRKYRAWLHPYRPGMLHGFVQKEDEQIRGTSILAPAMKLFRDMSDYLDYELIGTIVSSAFPVWIETDKAHDAADYYGTEGTDEEGDKTYYNEVPPGQVMYGNEGEKPHVLSSQKPSSTFGEFTKRMLKSEGASVGMPYEIVTKDFTETNYSSARAALLEADKTFRSIRNHFIMSFLQPTWGMVLEEAWLRGELELPRDIDFYEYYDALTEAIWIPPKRGHVDPVKETQADVKALREGTKTWSEVVQERGNDWEAHLDQIKRERDRISELGLQFGETKQ